MHLANPNSGDFTRPLMAWLFITARKSKRLTPIRYFGLANDNLANLCVNRITAGPLSTMEVQIR